MDRPRRVSEPHSGGGWATRVVDAPLPEARVGRACVPVNHENLERFGWSERTDEGRRRVVRSALRFAAEIGVQVVVPPAKTPPGLPEGAVVVSQPPPSAFRSNGDWAADLMKRVARHYLADAREGPRAVESLLFYGLTGRTADYAGALAQGLGYLRDQLHEPGARTGRPRLPAGVAGGDHAALRASLLEHVGVAAEVWGSPHSPYACARVLTRAHTERACSPLALDAAPSELHPLSPSPYGDTVGGWFAWHLAETRPDFRQFDPGEFAADCNEWLAARAAEDLLDKAHLRGVVDGVPARVSSGPVRDALEALPVPPDIPAVYGLVVSDQAAGQDRHPLGRPRPRLDPVVGVEPAVFRELDSRRPEDAVVLEDRILGLCAGSGVAVKLHDSGRVRSFHESSSRAGLGADVVHPVPERFGSTEDWGRSLLGAVALAVQTHPRLYDHARLDRLFGRDAAEGARMFDDAAGVLCDRYGLDASAVVSRARAFEAKPVGDWAGVSALDEIEDRTGVPATRFEVARRVFWTALGDACEREGVARGWADAAIGSADHDHVMLERVRRAALQDVSLAVRGCDRVLDLSTERTWGAVRPSGAVERSVAEVVADRLLSNVGAAGPTLDLDRRDSPRVREVVGRLTAANRPADAVLAEVAPGFAVGGDRDDVTVVEVVRERAEAVTEFMLDPTRAWRPDRVGDVAHSRSAEPWTLDLDRRDSPRVREVVGRLTAANRPADAVLAEVAPGFAVGGDRDDVTVVEVVRERAEAVTEFMLDPTRAWRPDRVGDVAHSRSAEPWRDLERARAGRASEVEPEVSGKRGTGRDRAVHPSR